KRTFTPASPPQFRQVLRSLHEPASTLEEQDVAPDAVELAEPLAPAHDLEADAAVEGKTGLVLRGDARLDRPDTRSFRGRDERFEQHPTDPAAASARRDIHAVLDDAVVHAAVGDPSGRHPADDLAVAERNEPVILEMSLVPPVPGRHVGLEGRIARRDPLR